MWEGWDKRREDGQEWPKEAAEVYYLIGMCHMEIPNHLKAYEAFNDAIRINADYPEVRTHVGRVGIRGG